VGIACLFEKREFKQLEVGSSKSGRRVYSKAFEVYVDLSDVLGRRKLCRRRRLVGGEARKRLSASLFLTTDL
jgi:hypothetical protein